MKMNNWTRITEKLPPLGTPVICTIKDHIYGGKMELRYPVYYLAKPTGDGYGFFYDNFNNCLIPEVSEVIAWQKFPKTAEVNEE